MRCCILEDRVAVWKLKDTNLRLSALAADILVEKKKLSWNELRLIRHCEWNDFEGPGEPISGITTSITKSLTGMASGVGSIPFRVAKSTKKRQKYLQKKRQTDSEENNGRAKVTANGKSAKEAAGESPSGQLSKKESETRAADEAAEATNGRATKDADLVEKTERGTPVLSNDINDNSENGVAGGSVTEDYPVEHVAEEYAQDVGKGLGKSGEAFARGTRLFTSSGLKLLLT